MSLILAIEPDRRQVAHLISIVRHVKGAELILADTTERALESIGNSVPDLILVPALLSPSDDAALAAALRVIATAAHVQMLTIPTFATPKPQPKKGVLSAFRRKPANDAPLDGCDPKVFAEEIASYLERASEERAAAQLYEDELGRSGRRPGRRLQAKPSRPVKSSRVRRKRPPTSLTQRARLRHRGRHDSRALQPDLRVERAERRRGVRGAGRNPRSDRRAGPGRGTRAGRGTGTARGGGVRSGAAPGRRAGSRPRDSDGRSADDSAGGARRIRRDARAHDGGGRRTGSGRRD